MSADINAIRKYLEHTYGPEPVGNLICWTREENATRAFDLAKSGSIQKAAEYAASSAAHTDVYFAMGLQKTAPARGKRGDEQGVIALPGLWADIDIRGGAHAAENLPETEAEALSLVEALGLPPSVIVHSGHGLQVHWRLKELYIIDNEADRKKLKDLSVRFQNQIRRAAERRGWTIDITADLCRLLRVPGTFNRKLGDDVRPVSAEYRNHCYTLDDFQELTEGVELHTLEAPDPSKHNFPPANIDRILDGCVWMAHCRDAAATLPEPEWYRMLTVVARCEDAERWAHELSQGYPKYSRAETDRKLKRASSEDVAPVTCSYVQSGLGGDRFCGECLFRGNVNSPITIGRLTHDSLPSKPDVEVVPTESGSVVPAAGPLDVVSLAALRERCTDLGNAKRFAARYRDMVLHCERWNRWYTWDGRRWREDDVNEVFRLAGDLIRSLYDDAKHIADEQDRKEFLSHLNKSEAHRAHTAMLSLAKADPRLAVRPDDLDAHPWLLTVENGTIDLRTGKLGPHQQSHRITKLAPVFFDPAATCPNWLAFLDLIFNQNRRLIEFLKRAFGYCLTGISSEKAMFILHGPGGDNGKSTVVDVFQQVLGDFATRTPTETFLKKKDGAIPNDVAKLKGARFVWASENERGSRLSEALIKEMTGGDKLSARFMRGEFFEFYPEFKPWLATNHKPNVRGDRALWNRLKLIPFEVSIPKEKQIPRHEAMEMYKAEFPGILNWGLEGCLEWQRGGLDVPEEVILATREYEEEQDTFAMFLDQKCIRTPNATTLATPIFRAYQAWAGEVGETPVSQKVFGSILSERGFKKTKTMRGNQYHGIGLQTEPHYDRPIQRPPTPGVHLFPPEDGELV
ncbi:MAG TPA: phage/plasmid primase, P4 family [Bryobacteraceae bacterium]|nr:phage/plasmid primase, P4 family [Bryobacteraceae bacterium]